MAYSRHFLKNKAQNQKMCQNTVVHTDKILFTVKNYLQTKIFFKNTWKNRKNTKSQNTKKITKNILSEKIYIYKSSGYGGARCLKKERRPSFLSPWGCGSSPEGGLYHSFKIYIVKSVRYPYLRASALTAHAQSVAWMARRRVLAALTAQLGWVVNLISHGRYAPKRTSPLTVI